MDKVYLQWNIVNTITVVLMYVVFMTAMGFAVSAFHGFNSGGDNA